NRPKTQRPSGVAMPQQASVVVCSPSSALLSVATHRAKVDAYLKKVRHGLSARRDPSTAAYEEAQAAQIKFCEPLVRSCRDHGNRSPSGNDTATPYTSHIAGLRARLSDTSSGLLIEF